MAEKYSGPYRVLERGNKVWKVQVDEKVEILSRDYLKPHPGSVHGPSGRRAAQAWETEDGFCGFYRFGFFGSEARGACVCVAGEECTVNPLLYI